jgi:hypothetical protein
MAGDDDTAETPAVGAAAAKEDEQSPADAQRAGEGRPQEPTGPAVSGGTAGEGTPEGTGPGGSVRGGYGVGATGSEGGKDVRGPSSTGSAGGGQSPADAQRAASGDDAFADKPHLYVAGAFVGGLLVAQVLKRFGGDDD